MRQTTEEILEEVNNYFNSNFIYVDDWTLYKEKDYWASPNEFKKRRAGDCEDFAIAKMAELESRGIPSKNLFLLYGRLWGKGEHHIALGYQKNENADFLVLDIPGVCEEIQPLTTRRNFSLIFPFPKEKCHQIRQYAEMEKRNT